MNEHLDGPDPKFDPIYYKNRYQLSLKDRDSIEHHYRKVGLSRGYFPNAERERFYLQMSNFDPEYYKRKYNLSGSNSEVMQIWKKSGFKKRNFVNKCEEDMAHHPFMCKCKIVSDRKNERLKNPIQDSAYSKDLIDHENVRDPIMTEKTKYIFSTHPSEQSNSEQSINDNDNSCTCMECAKNLKIKNSKSKNTSSNTKHTLPEDESQTPSELRMQKDIQYNLYNKVIDQSVMQDYSEYTKPTNSKITHKMPSKNSGPKPDPKSNSKTISKTISKSNSKSNSKSKPNEIEVKVTTKGDNDDVSIHGLSTLPEDVKKQIEADVLKQIKDLDNISVDTNFIQNHKSQVTESDMQYFDYSFCRDNDTKKAATKNDVTKSSSSDELSVDSNDTDKTSATLQTFESNHTLESADTGVLSSMFGRIGQIGQSIGHLFRTNPQKDTIIKINNKLGKTSDNNPNKLSDDENSIYETAIDVNRNETESICECSECQKIDDVNSLDVLCTECQKNDDDDTVCHCDSICSDLDCRDNDNDTTMNSIAPMNTSEIINIITKNIVDIESYLRACEIHLDTCITLMKDVVKSLQIILTPSKKIDQMEYDAARMRIKDLLIEIDSIYKSSRYNGLPIFVDHQSKSKLIRFPMFYAGRRNRHIVESLFPSHQKFFTMELIRLSLRELRLKRYSFPLLRSGQKMTPLTNPFPPTKSDFMRKPNRSEYSDIILSKCWNEEHHLKRFERALHRILMVREALRNHLKIIASKKDSALREVSITKITNHV